MKIIFMGTPDFAVPTLKKLYDSGYEVQAVSLSLISQRAEAISLLRPL